MWNEKAGSKNVLYLHMHIRNVGNIDPTSQWSHLWGEIQRGSVFHFLLYELVYFGFCNIYILLLFYENKNKKGYCHFRKKQSPGHRLFQWHFLAFLVCQNCSPIITAPHTPSRDTGSSQFILAVPNYVSEGIFRIREHFSSDKGLCK